jgi:hypothetical protein
MLEVELTSELLIAGVAGMQDKKKSIDVFYESHEEIYPNQSRDEKRFSEVMNTISETFPGASSELEASEFHRPPLFYTLYCTVYHKMFGLPGQQRSTQKRRLTPDDRNALKDAVLTLSEIIADAKDPKKTVPTKYAAFVLACQRQTDNITPRKVRFNSLCDAC